MTLVVIESTIVYTLHQETKGLAQAIPNFLFVNLHYEVYNESCILYMCKIILG